MGTGFRIRSRAKINSSPRHERDRPQKFRRALSALRQGDGAGVQAVLLQALRRYRSQSMAVRRLCGSGEGRRRRGRRSARRTQVWTSNHDCVHASRRKKPGLARPAVRHAQARRHPSGRLCARCRPCPADRPLPRRSADKRRRAHHRGGGRGAGGRRLAGRRARRAADAVERRRQLHQHAVAGAHLPVSAADADHDARRMGGVQSLAGADGIDRRSGAQTLRGGGLSRAQRRTRSKAPPSAPCSRPSATSASPPWCCRSN